MALTTKERAQRILLVLGFVLDQGDTPVEVVCERFGISEEELTEDMTFVFNYVGIHPFTPDAYVTVTVEEGLIDVAYGDFFRQPLHLTSEEALHLLTAGEALLKAEGERSGATLQAAVEKVRTALGADTLTVQPPAADPKVLELLSATIEDHTSVVIDYLSYARDEVASRTVDPYVLQAFSDHWFLQAWCHEAEDIRMFRVDRILSAASTEDQFVVREVELAEAPAPGTGSSTQTVVLDVPAGDRWIADMYPVESVTEDGDRLRIEIRCGTTAFLERLLLRLSPGSSAVDAATGASVLPVRAAAASRILSRYGA